MIQVILIGQIPLDYTPDPFPMNMDPASVPSIPLKVCVQTSYLRAGSFGTQALFLEL